jgi:3-phenylpropionate/trans-cinnamate dioxygenase ferredoxin reductase component
VVALTEKFFKYVIVGGGVAGASAVAGIRDIDASSAILLICSEPHLPYHRPPLSKGLWLGKKSVNDIFVNPETYYETNKVALVNGNPAERLDARNKTVTCASGTEYSYGSLLIATGGTPRTFSGGQAGINYYRYLDDYVSLRKELVAGKSVVIAGGGFIGSEMAAVLSACGVGVTMVVPERYLCASVFPVSLGTAVLARFARAGIRILTEDKPLGFDMTGTRPVTRTVRGETIVSDCIIAGIGLMPSSEIAEKAGLLCDNGIVVNERLQTSAPDVYAAGDVARFPYHALSSLMRMEHWDNAVSQGRLAGRNMAGAQEAYGHMPYFFSDLFEYGYEAVGDVSPSSDTIEDWQKEHEKGVIYYVKNNRCVGVLLFNVWDKCDAARAIIRAGTSQPVSALRGAIR